MQNENLLKIDLQLFADGAAAGEGGEGAMQATQSDLPVAGDKEGSAKRQFHGEGDTRPRAKKRGPRETVVSWGADEQGSGAMPGACAGEREADFARTPGSGRRQKSGELSNVVYGKQEDAPAPDATSSDAGSKGQGSAESSGVMTKPEGTSQSEVPSDKEAKRKAFEELIEGEYKDQYTEKFNAYFNRRFKQAKETENSLNAQKPIMDMLLQRYKIADGDLGKLQAAIEDDSQYWESAAEEAGMTVEQYKAMQKLQRENEELRRIRQREEGQQRMNQQLEQWYRQAEGVKALYPSFDFRRESADRDFLGLLRAGIPVQKAYELMHMDEIKEQAARSAAQTAGQQVEARIKAKAARPSENGTSFQSAAVIKSDVSHLTRADRAEIARRARRGEKIRF